MGNRDLKEAEAKDNQHNADRAKRVQAAKWQDERDEAEVAAALMAVQEEEYLRVYHPPYLHHAHRLTTRYSNSLKGSAGGSGGLQGGSA